MNAAKRKPVRRGGDAVVCDFTHWPRLKISLHPVLDWLETEYTKAQLLEIADAVHQTHAIEGRTPQGSEGIWNAAIEKVLRKLAGTPKALAHMNRRRTTPPNRVKGLNRAVHFHVRMALHPNQRKKALYYVAQKWCVSETQVKDDVAKYFVDDGDPCVPGGWSIGKANAPFYVNQIVNSVCHRSGKTRAEVLADFDADMCDRGATEVERKKVRRKKGT
jgi:hypothetical protein